jgi:hypothetical protein
MKRPKVCLGITHLFREKDDGLGQRVDKKKKKEVCAIRTHSFFLPSSPYSILESYCINPRSIHLMSYIFTKHILAPNSHPHGHLQSTYIIAIIPRVVRGCDNKDTNYAPD